MHKIRILLADDHAVVRDGTKELLEREADLEVVAEASDGREAVQLAIRERPDLIGAYLQSTTLPRGSARACKACAAMQTQAVAPSGGRRGDKAPPCRPPAAGTHTLCHTASRAWIRM